MKTLFAIVAVTGLITIGTAITASHMLHVQVKTVAQAASADSVHNANALSSSVDSVCLMFGALGTIQLAYGLIGGTRRPKRGLSNQPSEGTR